MSGSGLKCAEVKDEPMENFDDDDDAGVATTKPGFRMSLREIPSSLKTLLSNLTFMSLNMSGACEG